MGNCVGGFKRRTHRIAPWKRNKPIVLCFIGIDGAGKTTIVKALQGEDFGTVHATMGFSRAELRIKKYRITVYDLGGSARIREIWPIYFAEVFGIVFVMDSSAVSRVSENKKMVDSLVGQPDLLGKPILFLLNKKDLPEALDEMQFSERFHLHSMATQNKTDIRVEGICAVKGTGKEIDQVIVEGLEWLIEKVLDNYDSISKGVEKALKELKERQAQERLERQHRLALSTSKESPEAAGTPVNGDQDEKEEEEGIDQKTRIGTEERERDEEIVRENERLQNVESLAQNGAEPINASPRGGQANGGIDYAIFEISQQKICAIGDGQINEAVTTNDEEKKKTEEEKEVREEEKREGSAGREEREQQVQAVQRGEEGREESTERERSAGNRTRAEREQQVQAVQQGEEGREESTERERSAGNRTREEREQQVQAVQRGEEQNKENAQQRERSAGSERTQIEAVRQQGIVEIEMRQSGGSRSSNSRGGGGSANRQNGHKIVATLQ